MAFSHLLFFLGKKKEKKEMFSSSRESWERSWKWLGKRVEDSQLSLADG
jgi:hypothetical protein